MTGAAAVLAQIPPMGWSSRSLESASFPGVNTIGFSNPGDYAADVSQITL